MSSQDTLDDDRADRVPFNGLCCQTNPVLVCEGCGVRWCNDHELSYRWRDAISHRNLGYSIPKKECCWDCPVVGHVRRVEPRVKDAPWAFRSF